MFLPDYFPILVQILLAAGLAAVILGVSALFGQRAGRSRIKDTAYECGIEGAGETRVRFSVKFFVTAMLFILFDVEIVFLIPWVLVFRDMLAESVPIFLPVMFFLFILILGLVYEIKKGALEWER